MAMQELGRLRRFPCLHCAATNIPGLRGHRLFDLQSTFPVSRVRQPSRDLGIRVASSIVSSLRGRVGETKFVVERSRHCDADEGFKGFETLQPKMPIQVRPVKPVEPTLRET